MVLDTVMLSVTNKLLMSNGIMLRVVILSVVAPYNTFAVINVVEKFGF